MPEAPSMNDVSYRLNCLVEGKYWVFSVTVGHDCKVSDLKEVVQKKWELDALKDIGTYSLDLWKVNIDLQPYEDDERSLRYLKIDPNVEGVKMMAPWNSIGTYWSDEPLIGHLHIIVKVVTAEDDNRQHDDTYPITGTISQLFGNTGREWAVYGAIRSVDIQGCYYVDPGIQDESKLCLTALLEHQFILLTGPRASGKTTRLLWLKRELEAKGCQVIYFKGLSSPADFLAFFQRSAWKGNVVLLIDSFNQLYHASPTIQEECLRAFTEVINKKEAYAICGIFATGTSGSLDLTPTYTTPQFNIAKHVMNPYFSIDETRKLFLEFAQDNLITIDDAVIEDLWVKSNGHPGMVCLCGRTISENLVSLLALPDRILSYRSWLKFSATYMREMVYEYATFKTMIKPLLNEKAAPAVNLLRSYFVGFLETVYIQESEQEQQANFLTAAGVLLHPTPNHYCVASAFVDGLIRGYLIPRKFPNAPSTPFPMGTDGQIHVLEILTRSVKFFDKELIRLAAVRSYKQSKVTVGGLRNVQVPRESVYDTELMRILTNWLGTQGAYRINGQWHLRTGQNKNKYCDIVISKPTTPTVVLELLATGDVNFVRAHIDKIPDFKDVLSSNEAWVVHFTREDAYLDHPTWQSDEQLQKGINVVHFWHDEGFSTVSMSARWKDADGNIQQVDNQHCATSLKRSFIELFSVSLVYGQLNGVI